MRIWSISWSILVLVVTLTALVGLTNTLVKSDFKNQVLAASGYLEESDYNSGSFVRVCTVTIFDRYRDPEFAGYTYRAFTSAHCVSDPFGGTDPGPYQVRFESHDDTTSWTNTYPATVASTGTYSPFMRDPDDYAVIKFQADQEYPAIPVGDSEKLQPGDDIAYVGNADNEGLQFYQGRISRSFPDANRKWLPRDIVADVNLGPGSSGAGVVSLKQKALVGIVADRLTESPGIALLYPLPVRPTTEPKIAQSVIKSHTAMFDFTTQRIEESPSYPSCQMQQVILPGARKPTWQVRTRKTGEPDWSKPLPAPNPQSYKEADKQCQRFLKSQKEGK